MLYPKENLQYGVYVVNNLGNDLGLIGNGVTLFGLIDVV